MIELFPVEERRDTLVINCQQGSGKTSQRRWCLKSVLGKRGIPKAERRMGWRSGLAWGDGMKKILGEKNRPSLIAQLVKSLPAMRETPVRFLGWEEPLQRGKAYPLQYSGLESSMDCTVHGVSKSRTGLSDFHFSRGKSGARQTQRMDRWGEKERKEKPVMANSIHWIVRDSHPVVRSRSVKPWCILLILGTGRKAKVLGQGPHQGILNEKIPERKLKKKKLF